MKRLSVVVVVIWALSVLIAACGGGAVGGPVGAVQSWLGALAKLDFKTVTDLTCAAQKDQVTQALALFNGGSSGTDLSALKDRFTFDFSKLTFKENSNDGKIATIHVGGQMVLTAFGQDQNQDMNSDVQIVTEGGQWKVCGNPLNK